jgi:LmbE family N-acetylglucosaminyl deacetylase
MIFGKRILVLVPHPDDEVVASCAAIGQAQTQGSEIFALYLTHGCIARETLWPWQRKNYEKYVARRRAEGEKTANFLNIKPLFWNPRPARHLWKNLRESYEEIQSAIATNDIDQLWVPAYEGGNADHDALNALAAKWKSENQKSENSVLEFAEYNFSGGKTHSQEFPFPNGTEQRITLNPDEQKKKRGALAIYESEKMNLSYVKSDIECYRPLSTYNYSRPPHPGTLWYARFQWVPFHHPRVDFTNPNDVSRAITTFLNNHTP